MSESNIDPANLKASLKDAEDMVTQARLDEIARQNKSIGALLDNRVLYKVEEIKPIR